jgi:hypothetical protein
LKESSLQSSASNGVALWQHPIPALCVLRTCDDVINEAVMGLSETIVLCSAAIVCDASDDLRSLPLACSHHGCSASAEQTSMRDLRS